MSLISQIESILFVASKPLTLKKISLGVKTSEQEVEKALFELKEKFANGIILVNNEKEWQMVSNPENKEVAENFIKAEVSGELTKPQLETLTVIAYSGPITKPELEQIRGVNCSLIIRNLMMRGLVKEFEGEVSILPRYEVTIDFLRYLGLSSLNELPDYAELHNHDFIQQALQKGREE